LKNKWEEYRGYYILPTLSYGEFMKKSLKKISINIVILFFVAGYISSLITHVEKVRADDEYLLVWEDDFLGNSLDRSIWNVEENGDGGGNQELQYYRDSTENIEVSNGTLKIKGLRRSYGGKGYTSGRINTRDKAEFRYGKIEARMKLPSFQGAWPAFWMLGGNHSEIGWPRCGEIDIMEAINTQNYTHGALHWYGEGKRDSSRNSESIVSDGFDRTQWHVYGMEWTETEIKMMVDGTVFYKEDITDGYMGEFRKEQFIILNLAIGGQWPGFTVDSSKFPVTMEVDYVRVWQKKSQKNIIKGTGVNEKLPIVIPEKTETRNVIEYEGPWNIFYNTAVVKGTGNSIDAKGFTANIEYLGIKGRVIRASMTDIDCIPGNTYQYKCTFMSDMDKYISVKVLGEDPEEDVFANYTIFLQAGRPYKFSESVTISKEYDGKVDMIVEMGGRIGGEYLPADTSLTIKMYDASFVGIAEVLEEIPTKPIVDSTQTITTVLPVTTKGPDNNSEKKTSKDKDIISQFVKTKAKIVSVKRSNKGKTIKIKLKKIRGAERYQIRYATNKSIKKYKTIHTKKWRCTIKQLKAKRIYYVKVRAYKIVKKKKYYSSWSKIKKVKVKH